MSPAVRKRIFVTVGTGGLLLYYFHPNETVAYGGGGALMLLALGFLIGGDPVEALLYRIESRVLTRRDLEPFLGSRA